MVIFVLNMVSVSMVMMAAIVLIILRERPETQVLIASVFLEAAVALSSLLWVRPGNLEEHFLAIRLLGRTLEAGIMWYVIVTETRAIHKASAGTPVTDDLQQKFDELEQRLAKLDTPKHEDEPNDITH